jgi:hypothetical protein
MDADERRWRCKVVESARAAVQDLRGGDAFEHRWMIDDLERLVARLTDAGVEEPRHSDADTE